MNTRSRIILPVAIFFVGLATVLIGRSTGVSADAANLSSNSSLYILLTAAGFLLIAISAIVVLFMIASSEDKK